MTVKTEPFISGKYGWDFGESGWNVGADENWLKFSYLLSGVYHGFETNDDDAALYPDGTAYWNTSDNTINAKVNGVTKKYMVPKGFILTSEDGTVKWEFTGSALALAMTATDKTKLNGISAGATQNSSDAALRDRTTHTGQQSTTTISGLEPRLSGVETGKAPIANPSFSGNVSVLGGSARILGNFTNVSPASSTLFQTGTVNGTSGVGVIPNGTATSAGYNTYNSSDPNNSSRLAILSGAGFHQIRCDQFGAGPLQPLNVIVGGATRMSFLTNGNVGVGTDSPSSLFHVEGNTRIAGSLSLGSSSIATNGFNVLPNGMIEQWASVITNSSGTYTGSFPTAFPNACRSIQISATSTLGFLTVTSVSSTGFTITTTDRFLNGIATGVYVLAIGN
jgi:hypothetical protein